ncbi:hypothetical protein EJ04DRAFT_517114 [Polyplosphaeria fusca]|uniref:Zn(2)-C6 fungal-type domain-containing protein n=1 Tax=Polyplosphaeria fusca TaxID=682080 RepID=A0A9P4QL18_9PLEO|nr:hypothetical protein EJ04DRAFT_517114 [Polyplosphaeria fusca]
MLRRSHKKSRGGCAECKRRHVKCDETRPICRLCSNSGRDCSFASEIQSNKPPTPGASPHEQSTSPFDFAIFDAITPSSTCLSASGSPSFQDPTYQNDGLDEPLNLNHMELLIHLNLDDEIFNLGLGDVINPLGLHAGLRIALTHPYLMHQLLAISACHLSFIHPEKKSFYHHQAVSLQTRAVSIFNTASTTVDASNCAAILLFSTILGHHILADTLSIRVEGNLDVFVQQCIACLSAQRGVFAITQSAWPLLMETELEPILNLSRNFTSREPRGAHCDGLRGLVDACERLEVEEKEALGVAIHYLQLGFDAEVDGSVEPQYRFQMIYLWTMLVPQGYVDLLAARRPEALALLAYYAALLHFGRDRWQVRDAGVYVLGMIVRFLGDEWAEWVEYPKTLVDGELHG